MSITTNNDLERMCEELNIPLNGIYVIDELKNKKHKKGAYIYNLNGESHWVCSFDNEYFDSFGEDPPMEVIEFLGGRYRKNNKQIQNLRSNWCGVYCVCYLWFRSRGKSMRAFTDRFEQLSAYAGA